MSKVDLLLGLQDLRKQKNKKIPLNEGFLFTYPIVLSFLYKNLVQVVKMID